MTRTALTELAGSPSSPRAKIVFLQLAPISISSTALSSHTAVLFPELPLYNVANLTIICPFKKAKDLSFAVFLCFLCNYLFVKVFDAFYIRAKRLEFSDEVLIAPVDIIHSPDLCRTVGAQTGDDHSRTGAQVR